MDMEMHFPGLRAKLDRIEKSDLTWKERLGLAYIRLRHWQWDDIMGPKPEGFDSLPNFVKGARRKERCKYDYTAPALAVIRALVCNDELSLFWWRYVLGRSDEEWLRWRIQEYREIQLAGATIRRFDE